MTDALGQIVLILLFMVGSAFFAGIETGVISLNRLRLRHLVRHGAPGAETVERFLRSPDQLLGTTLVGTNLCHVIASVLAADLAARLFGRAGPTLAAVAMVLTILIFCEYLPKAWFQSSPTLRVLPLARPLKWSSQALMPLSKSMMFLVGVLIPAPKRDTEKAQPLITRDELLHLAKEGELSGIVTRDESRMIHSIFELRDTTCAEIMVPRDKVVFVRTDTTAGDILELARVREFNRFPVYDESKKSFVGIVHVFDVLCDTAPGGKTAASYMRPPQFVAHNTQADHILPRMRVTRQPLAMVMDARYDLVGIVTIENVLDEVVGQS
jgi:putative hemolysin